MSAEVENAKVEEKLDEKKQEAQKIIDDVKDVKEKEVVKEKSETSEEKEKQAKSEPPPPRVHKADFEKDVVYVYQFCRTPILPSLSPYCLKVESWLRLFGIKYENVDHKLKFRSSKGQLPFVELNGEEIADSTAIISKLSEHFGVDADAHLSKDDKNFAHSLISMIENHLNWVCVYWRSKNPDSFIKGSKLSLQHALGSRVPNAVLNIVFKLTYSRKGAKKVKAHGLGVHTPEEVCEFGKEDLQVLEDTLGKKEYFFGEKPSTLDLVAFAHLSQIAFIDKSIEYDLRDWMSENCPSLMGFINRMKERCFPDWDDILKTLNLNTHIEEKKEEGGEGEDAKVKEPEAAKEEGKGDNEKKEEKKEEESK